MIKKILLLAPAIILFWSCQQNSARDGKVTTSVSFGKKDVCCKKTGTELTCKLTTPEMDERKATVLTSLRKKVLEKKELPNGYAFKFAGSDAVIHELTDFAKTERHCCDFFTFNLSISGDTSVVWFEITGPLDAKEFVVTELEL